MVKGSIYPYEDFFFMLILCSYIKLIIAHFNTLLSFYYTYSHYTGIYIVNVHVYYIECICIIKITFLLESRIIEHHTQHSQ